MLEAIHTDEPLLVVGFSVSDDVAFSWAFCKSGKHGSNCVSEIRQTFKSWQNYKRFS